jgi:hypothetical protein
MIENIPLYNKSGKFLTNINERRIGWFTSRGLASFENKKNNKQLKLKLKVDPTDFYETLYKKDICVSCGSEQTLTDHHVIPRQFLKFLKIPQNNKILWVVCLCRLCHDKAEEILKNTKDELDAVYLKNFDHHQLEAWSIFSQESVFNLVQKNNGSEFIKILLKRINCKSVEEARKSAGVKMQLYSKQKCLARKIAIKSFINKFSLKELKQYFKDKFLQIQPKYLIEGFLN